MRCPFSKVFPKTTTQSQMYEYLNPTVRGVLKGVNCTVFAYGQTGSGKTHTMMGEIGDTTAGGLESNPLWGLIPRACHDIFAITAAEGEEAVVRASFMQIYNDNIFDLLVTSKSKKKKPLKIREQVRRPRVRARFPPPRRPPHGVWRPQSTDAGGVVPCVACFVRLGRRAFR